MKTKTVAERHELVHNPPLTVTIITVISIFKYIVVVIAVSFMVFS